MIPASVAPYVAELPPCDTRIELVAMSRQGGAGRGIIHINMYLARAMVRRVVFHEIGHCWHLKKPHWLKYFGEEPFITEYASVDEHEDFAETFAELYLNGATTRKSRILRRLLAH